MNKSLQLCTLLELTKYADAKKAHVSVNIIQFLLTFFIIIYEASFSFIIFIAFWVFVLVNALKAPVRQWRFRPSQVPIFARVRDFIHYSFLNLLNHSNRITTLRENLCFSGFLICLNTRILFTLLGYLRLLLAISLLFIALLAIRR